MLNFPSVILTLVSAKEDAEQNQLFVVIHVNLIRADAASARRIALDFEKLQPINNELHCFLLI